MVREGTMGARFEEIRRLRRSRRPGSQLSFVGFDSRRGETSRASRSARAVAAFTAGTPPPRVGRRPRPNHSARRTESVLSPMEQMEALLQYPHLLRSKDREWVAKIGETVRARGRGASLSDRQEAVICDIFDRLRERIGR